MLLCKVRIVQFTNKNLKKWSKFIGVSALEEFEFCEVWFDSNEDGYQRFFKVLQTLPFQYKQEWARMEIIIIIDCIARTNKLKRVVWLREVKNIVLEIDYGRSKSDLFLLALGRTNTPVFTSFDRIERSDFAITP